jgi:3-deoxy-D-manno-octulosonate 8-phosphate phosphatase (KDO 8-P phosphatase)
MSTIKLFVSDIDGTMTNGHMAFDHQGNVTKSYHTRDCTALWRLKFDHSIPVLLLTGSKAPCDAHRFRYLAAGDFDMPSSSIPLSTDHMIQGASYRDKEFVLGKYLKDRRLDWSEVAYIGDDLNDYACLEQVGWAACPKDAHPDIRYLCGKRGFISTFNGGDRAVEEFANAVIAVHSNQKKDLVDTKK